MRDRHRKAAAPSPSIVFAKREITIRRVIMCENAPRRDQHIRLNQSVDNTAKKWQQDSLNLGGPLYRFCFQNLPSTRRTCCRLKCHGKGHRIPLSCCLKRLITN